MDTNAKMSVNEYINALEKMKKSPKDRIGILGELGATGIGGVAGAGVAGVAASAAGAATLFGSSTLGSILGGVFVTTTPVGWIVGSIIAGGAIGYSISKLVSSGGKSDAVKEMNIQELTNKINELQKQSTKQVGKDEKINKIIEGVQLLIKNKKISQDQATLLLSGVEKGSTTIEFAFETISKMLAS